MPSPTHASVRFSPARFVHGEAGPVAIVPGRVAAWLAANAGLDRLRVEVRGVDAEVDAVLNALAVAAGAWRTSAIGSREASSSEVGPSSLWMTAAAAASELDITARAVTLAIAEGRLPGCEKVGRAWRIPREVVAHYLAARAA